MNNFEINKIFAALLVAGIVAMLGGFLSEKLVQPRMLEENAVEIEGGVMAAHAGEMEAEPMPEPILHLIAGADLEKGAKLSKACAACHSFDQGGPAKVGPNLWGVVLSPKASKDGFSYSDALRAHGGAWSYEDLNHFLWKPKKFVNGTKMSFIGLKKPEDRAAMIAWLRTKASSPAALPDAAAIEAEKAALSQP